MGVNRPPSEGSGGGGGTVVHYSQPFAGATVVSVNHNLGYIPDVNVQNTTGSAIVGGIAHTNINSFTVSFNVAQAGTVYYT